MATLKDIGRRAEVSTATVSRVLNRRVTNVPISSATRRKVETAAREMGYYPNAFARSLRLNKSFVIGVVVADIEDPWCGRIVRSISDALDRRGYRLVLADAGGSVEKEGLYTEDFIHRRVDGILVAGTPEHRAGTGRFTRLPDGIPAVLAGRTAPAGIPCVVTDNLAGGRLAIEYLLGKGRRTIGFLNGPATQPDAIQRLAGYRQALAAHRLPGRRELVVPAHHDPETGYRAMRTLIRTYPDIDACFAYNDFVALGAIKAAREAGRKIPEDISLVGFDDIPLATYFDPPLTTVRQPITEMGKTAAELLLAVIAGKAVPPKTVLKPELVVRAT